MKARVTEKGLLIPREVIERLGSEEVEISEEPGLVLISPATDADDGNRGAPGEDPIFGLGRNPVHTGTRDGSVNHDSYLYQGD